MEFIPRPFFWGGDDMTDPLVVKTTKHSFCVFPKDQGPWKGEVFKQNSMTLANFSSPECVLSP